MSLIPMALYERNFNPRSREGSDADGKDPDALVDISIHAPAKGATRKT